MLRKSRPDLQIHYKKLAKEASDGVRAARDAFRAAGVEGRLSSLEPGVAALPDGHRSFSIELTYTLDCKITLSDTLLGRGTYGAVVAGSFAGNDVAVKVPLRLQKDQGSGGSLEHMDIEDPSYALKDVSHEWLIMSHIGCHPNLIRSFGLLTTGTGLPCLVLDRAQCSLHDLLESNCKNGTESSLNRWKMMAQILQGLGHIHGKGVLHGDLKPNNILVSKSNTLQLADFGVARALQGGRTMVRGNEVFALGYRNVECLQAGKEKAGLSNVVRNDGWPCLQSLV